MDYAVHMTATPQNVSDELVEELRRHLDNGQLVELTYAIGWENFRARTNHALELDAAGFSEGAACAVPWRASHQRPEAVLSN
jgi:hypothetical protein